MALSTQEKVSTCQELLALVEDELCNEHASSLCGEIADLLEELFFLAGRLQGGNDED